MAKFNPDTGASTQIPDWTSASQGLPTNRAFEFALEGLGAVIEGAAKTKDYKIQEEIRYEAETVFDAANNQSNTSKVAQIVAPELEADPEVGKAMKMTEAYRQGAMSDSHYYSNFTALVKKLRARYPGYNEQIDTIVGQVTGFRPANAFKSAVDAEYEASVNAARQNASDLDKWFQNDAEYIYQIDPNFDLNRGKYASPSELGNLRVAVGRLKAQEQQVKADSAMIDNLNKHGQLDEKKSGQVFETHINNIVANKLTGLWNSAGVGGQDIGTILEQFQKNGPDDNTYNAIIGTFAKSRMEAEQAVDAYLNEILPESGMSRRSLLGAEALRIKKDAMTQFDALEAALTNKEWGAAVYWARKNKIKSDRDISTLMDKYPSLRTAAALGQISQQLLSEWVLYNPAAQELISNLSVDALAGVFTGTVGMDEAIDSIEQSGATQQEKNDSFTTFINGIAKTFESPTATDNEIKAFASAQFLGASTGEAKIDKFWQKISDPKDRETVFAKLTAPQVADRIAKLGDQKLLMDYVSWVEDAVSVVPSIRDAQMMIIENQQPVSDPVLPSGRKGNPYEITYDPAKRQFSAQVTVADDPIGWQSAIQKRAAAIANDKLRGINMVFGNLSYIMEKARLDPDAELQRVLQNLKIQSGNPRQGSLFDSLINSMSLASAQTEGGDKGSEGPFGSSQGSDNTSFEMFPMLAAYSPDEGTSMIPEDGEFSLEFEGTPSTEFAGATPLHDFIGNIEAPKGYNQIFGRNRMAPLDTMTVDEVIALQTSILRKGSPSSAVGRYQFLRKTLRGLKKQLGLTGDELMTADLQDKLATQLMKGRGLDKYLAGELSAEDFADNLSKEWASLPYRTGGSYYAGDGLNKSLVSREALLEQLNKLASNG